MTPRTCHALHTSLCSCVLRELERQGKIRMAGEGVVRGMRVLYFDILTSIDEQDVRDAVAACVGRGPLDPITVKTSIIAYVTVFKPCEPRGWGS